MTDALRIAASGAMTEARRVAASASNIANARTTGSLPDPNLPADAPRAYEPVRVESVSNGPEQGVRPSVRKVDPAWVAAYEPDAPYANSDGLVAAPNVDLVNELTTQMVAKRAYEANLKVIETASSMDRKLLDIVS
jgi:flagellar basal-body rod protein FlgC